MDSIGVPYKQLKAKGREVIEVFNGGKIEFRTRTSKGGLGEGYDLLVIDEAQEYTTDQESTLKYVITDSENPQTILCGTPPTPISSGTVFVKYRELVMSGKAERFGWAEWSVEKQSDITDKELWYETNPSLGLKLDLESIEDEVTGGEEIDINIQRLGLWITYSLKSAITAPEWEKTLVDKLPELQGKMNIGIKYHVAGDSVSMAIATATKDEKIFVEVIDNRAARDGTKWIVAFCKKAEKSINKIVIDGESGQKILEKALKEAKIRKTVLPKTKDIIEANALFASNLDSGKMCRMEQPSLTGMVTHCKKRPIGHNGGFGYTELIEEYDVSLMDSVLLAMWAAEKFKEGKPQEIGY